MAESSGASERLSKGDVPPMSRLLTIALSFACAALSAVALAADEPAKPGQKAAPKALNVLFLGDQGHHRPADRAAQLTPVLAGRGIKITYTEKLDDLNRETLGRYDALLIYANIDADRPRPGEGAARLRRRRRRVRAGPLRVVLLPQLARGTSPWSVPSSSGTARASSTPRSSIRRIPIMKGFEPFRTWDETYVHHKHNEQGPPRPPGPRRRASPRSPGRGSGPRARGASSTRRTATTRGPGRTRASRT